MQAVQRCAAWSSPGKPTRCPSARTCSRHRIIAAALALAALGSGCRSTETGAADARVPARAAFDCPIERCNSLDDDCDGILDEDADSSCHLAHASARCIHGTCVLDACDDGFLDCNQSSQDGCEAQLECEPSAAQPDASATSTSESKTVSPMALDAGAAAKPDAALAPTPDDADAGGSEPSAGHGHGNGNGMGGNGNAMGMGMGNGNGMGNAGGRAPLTDAGPPAQQPAPGGDAAVPTNVGLSSPANMGLAGDVDAGASCGASSCEDEDNDCDDELDERQACTCAQAQPTGQGSLCDRCYCEMCTQEKLDCTGTDDAEWNQLCGELVACFGRSVQAGLCTGSDSDCYQRGTGPCADEFRSAFGLGWDCTSDPVETPCGALTQVRLSCYRTRCASVCLD